MQANRKPLADAKYRARPAAAGRARSTFSQQKQIIMQHASIRDRSYIVTGTHMPAMLFSRRPLTQPRRCTRYWTHICEIIALVRSQRWHSRPVSNRELGSSRITSTVCNQMSLRQVGSNVPQAFQAISLINQS